jgi:hypothetical protein
VIVGAVALCIQQWRQVAERHPHRRVALCRREPHGAAGVEPDGVVRDEVVSSALAGADGGGVRLRREWKEAARARGGGGGPDHTPIVWSVAPPSEHRHGQGHEHGHGGGGGGATGRVGKDGGAVSTARDSGGWGCRVMSSHLSHMASGVGSSRAVVVVAGSRPVSSASSRMALSILNIS